MPEGVYDPQYTSPVVRTVISSDWEMPGENPHSKPRYTLHTQQHHQLGIENTIQKSRVETWSRNLWEREVFCWHHPCINNQKHQFICLYNHPVLNLFTKHSVITWHNATLLCGSGGELHTDGNDSEGSGSVGTPDSGHTHLSQLSLLQLHTLHRSGHGHTHYTYCTYCIIVKKNWILGEVYTVNWSILLHIWSKWNVYWLFWLAWLHTPVEVARCVGRTQHILWPERDQACLQVTGSWGVESQKLCVVVTNTRLVTNMWLTWSRCGVYPDHPGCRLQKPTLALTPGQVEEEEGEGRGGRKWRIAWSTAGQLTASVLTNANGFLARPLICENRWTGTNLHTLCLVVTVTLPLEADEEECRLELFNFYSNT